MTLNSMCVADKGTGSKAVEFPLRSASSVRVISDLDCDWCSSLCITSSLISMMYTG